MLDDILGTIGKLNPDACITQRTMGDDTPSASSQNHLTSVQGNRDICLVNQIVHRIPIDSVAGINIILILRSIDTKDLDSTLKHHVVSKEIPA